MAALNYYLGLARGANNNIYNVTAGTSTAGTAVDVELNIQINNGSTATGITKKDVKLLVETLLGYLLSNGVAGADLPPL